MKKVILILTLIVTVPVVTLTAGQRKFKIAFMIAGNGSTQYTVVEAPDSGTAQQIFKHTCQECKFVGYTEIK
jgi:hypothetical protein